MTPIRTCPEPARLQRLLNPALSAEEQPLLMEHLEGCAACRQTLEELAADRQSWADVARNLRGESGPEPTQGEEKPGSASLDFLDPPEKPGQIGKLGHYEILEVIGHGGMGVVLKGFDQTLHRVVAVKVMAPQLAASGSARERFQREAQAAAAVSHDHVVTIHAVDEAKGLPYLVMQYVHGLSLQEKLDREGPLELKEILRIGMQTADGLAAAHAQGLIHRDIKPANILLENGVNRVKITDFGLARAADDASLTQSGVIAGTPQYMSPEQSLGEPQDYRTDLFSLGSVLYALCTGRPPFRASNALAVLRRVEEDKPRPIRQSNPEIPDWLEAIVAKLMEKHPADRFQSAAEVARLLESHLAQLQQPAGVPRPVAVPVSKKPPKKPKVVFWLAVVAAIFLAFIALLVSLPFVYEVPESMRPRPVPPVPNPPTMPLEPKYTFSVANRGRLLCVAIDPDERTVAAGFEDGSVVVWDLATGRPTILEGHKLPVRSAAFTSNGKKLLTGGGEILLPGGGGEVKVWDLAAGKVSTNYPWNIGPVFAVAVSPDDKTHAAGGAGWFELWDADTGRPRPLSWVPTGIQSIAFAPDSQTVAAGGIHRLVYFWDPLTGKQKGVLRGHTDVI